MENSGQTLRIEALLEECIKRKSSDLHIQVGLSPILRTDGRLVPIAGLPVVTEEMAEQLIFATLDEEQQKI